MEKKVKQILGQMNSLYNKFKMKTEDLSFIRSNRNFSLNKTFQIKSNTMFIFFMVSCLVIFYSVISFPFSVDSAKDDAKKKHDFFYNEISPIEKRNQFAVMYNGWRWSYGINKKIKTVDCLNSWKGFYAKFGAKLENASIPGLAYRLQKIKKENPKTRIIRRHPREVVAGDYIILDYSSYKTIKTENGKYKTVPHINRHIGMVTDITPNGWVRYASVEVQTGTETLNIIRFNDRHIVFIAEMDEDLFAGNF
jgi:hypothetical protein